MPASSSPEESFRAALQAGLPSILPQFLVTQRWFGGKARSIRSVEISDIVPFCLNTDCSYFVLAKVEYAAGPAETYDIPLVRTSGASDSAVLRVRLQDSFDEILLKDALTDEQFLVRLLEATARGVSFAGANGELRAIPTLALRALWEPSQGPLRPSLMNVEQSNSSILYGRRLVLKIFRRLEDGLNPDLEVGSFLTEKSPFRNVPPLAGSLEYVNHAGSRTALGILQGYVENQGDAWAFTLKALAEYYGKAQLGTLDAGEIPAGPLLALSSQAIPDEAKRRIGSYLDSAALLGRRTAELHLGLASALEDPNFVPQPFVEPDHQQFVTSALQHLTANFDLLRRLKDDTADRARQEAERVLRLEEIARRRFQLSAQLKCSAMVTRIHGDYHLGQVLFTGSDFVIIDFEGEPARPLEERRKKRSPLQDVAGMLRSFHYAAYAPLLQQGKSERLPEERLQTLGNWAQYWQRWVSAAFLKKYLEVSGNSMFIPRDREELALLLDLYLLDKAIYELGYELNNRPTWIRIPLDGISQLLHPSG